MSVKLTGIYLTISLVFFSLTNLACAQTWTKLNPTGELPIGRDSFSASYDSTNNRMIIFGGIDYYGNLYNDVWVLSNANGLDSTTPAWTQLNPSPDPLYEFPSTRWGHKEVYDNTDNRLIIFGGLDINENTLNDVWVLSNANGLDTTIPAWTQLTPLADSTYGFPSNRDYPSVVYNRNNNSMILFGGNTAAPGSGPFNNYLFHVWILSNANGLDTTIPAWERNTSVDTASTLVRFAHTAVYDDANNIMTVFAGGNNTGWLNDVWVLNNSDNRENSNWTQLTPLSDPVYGFPATRDYHKAIYDSINNRMTIFGGWYDWTTQIFLNDVWVLTNANGLDTTVPAWIQLIPTPDPIYGLPTTRANHTALYDIANNRMIIFGGVCGYTNTDPNQECNDVWVLSSPNGLSAPEPGFYGTPTTGIGPLQVSFVDTSKLKPTSWNWNLGDGVTTGFTLSSTTTHIYGIVAAPTTYNVQMIVSNSYGTTTSTMFNYISVTEPGPNSYLSGAPLYGYGSLTVYFFDGSDSLYGNSTSWHWTFGDGSTSNLQNPVHIYAPVSSVTAYTVQLIVTTNFGASTTTMPNYIIVFPLPAVEDWMFYSSDINDTTPQVADSKPHKL